MRESECTHENYKPWINEAFEGGGFRYMFYVQ